MAPREHTHTHEQEASCLRAAGTVPSPHSGRASNTTKQCMMGSQARTYWVHDSSVSALSWLPIAFGAPQCSPSFDPPRQMHSRFSAAFLAQKDP